MVAAKVTVCSCNACKSMCKTSPCFGTPENIVKLIEAGYAEKLIPTGWVDIQWEGLWPVISPIKTANGCIFLTPNGLCLLHDQGLKPLEGRLAIHDDKDPECLRRMICYSWISPLGEDLLKLFNAPKEIMSRLAELRKSYSR